MLKWNDEGEIVEFKVLIRPLKAVNLIHQKMAAMVARANANTSTDAASSGATLENGRASSCVHTGSEGGSRGRRHRQ